MLKHNLKTTKCTADKRTGLELLDCVQCLVKKEQKKKRRSNTNNNNKKSSFLTRPTDRSRYKWAKIIETGMKKGRIVN